jgi:hypothetical protein
MNITKEQIKEWLNEKSPEIISFHSTNMNLGSQGHLISLMEQCFNDLAPKWVSVDDELPNDGEEVLMYMNDGAVMSDIKCHSGRYSNKYGFERSRVTHWMPLPEPPK